MRRNWYSIKALADDTAEISILEEIGYWGINAKQFAADFKAITASKIKLVINSPGGSVTDAVTIFNILAASGKDIEVKVLGIAASAASFLAMVGTRITMPENTFMFLHNPINFVYGNADEMRDMADVLDKFGASITAMYAKRWNGTEQALKDVLAAETYLTAAECLEHGLCDEVTPAIAATAKFEVEDLPENVRAVFQAASKPPEVPPGAVPIADLIKACAEAEGLSDYVSAFVADTTLTDEASVRAAIGSAKEVVALCGLVEMKDKAPEFIRARKTPVEARKCLADAMAEASDAAAVDTAAKSGTLASKPAASQAINPTDLWQEIRAMNDRSKK